MTTPDRHLTRGRIFGLDHLTLAVTDLDVAERFYADVLGGTMVDRQAGHLVFDLGAGPHLQLVLEPGRPRAVDAHPHIGFAVGPGDLLSFRAALTAAGVPTAGPTRLGPPGLASLHFLDPFGNHLELTTMGYDGPMVDAADARPYLGGMRSAPSSRMVSPLR